MEQIKSPDGTTVSFDKYGSGPPLVLIHGALSDHKTNWEQVKDLLASRYAVYAIARRGRGETTATQGHSLADEAADAAAVIESIGVPVFLLGHSYGAQCALSATALAPEKVSKLVLYEAPWPNALAPELMARFDAFAATKDWDNLVQTLMSEVLEVPEEGILEMKESGFWDICLADAEPTLGDFHALITHHFSADDYRKLPMPVLLLVGSESSNDIYVTDALEAVLPNSQRVPLEGQAHEGMTTAPELFVDTIDRFLLA